MDPKQQTNQQPQQAFQAAQQTPAPSPSSVNPSDDSLSAKIKAHKTAVIVAIAGFLLLSGMGTYILVSPSQKTLVAPATLDPNATLPPIPTSTIAPTQTTNKSTAPASSWKTYTNNTYGYSIKYPPDWKIVNIGVLEPKIPSYIVFNAPDATASARDITVSISTRSYNEQLTLGASNSATTVAGIAGTKQSFQDSDGNTSTVITLPRSSNLLVLRSKTTYLTIFNQMITTLTIK